MPLLEILIATREHPVGNAKGVVSYFSVKGCFERFMLCLSCSIDRGGNERDYKKFKRKQNQHNNTHPPGNESEPDN